MVGDLLRRAACMIHGESSGKADESQRESLNCCAPWLGRSAARARYPHEFIGGQRQRIGSPAPWPCGRNSSCAMSRSRRSTSASAHRSSTCSARLQREFGLTYLFISHSMPVVRYPGDAHSRHAAGDESWKSARSMEITRAPQHPYTRTLLAATPQIEIA